MNRSTPGLPLHHQLPEFTQTHVHRVGDASNHLILFVPFSSCPQSLPASGSFPMSQLFSSGGQSIGVSASVSVLPMNTPGLFSFRMDWLDLLAVQGTLKGLLQHHSSKNQWLSEEALQIAVKRREAKSKEEKESYSHLNAEFQRTARRDKKAFLSYQCKEIEENNRMGKIRDLFKRLGFTP